MATMMLKANRPVARAFFKFPGTTTTKCSLLASKIRLSCLELGFGFGFHRTLSVLFHSNSFLNPTLNFDHPRSVSKKITKLDAFKLFDETWHIQPPPSSMSRFLSNVELSIYCKKLKMEEAMHCFREMAKTGLKPDLDTYNDMFKGLFEVGRSEAARELFNEMQTHGQIPNECTYKIIIEGLCNNHLVDEALSVFRLMGNYNLDSDIVVYNSLIGAASKCGKLDIARFLFNELSVKGLQPDVRTHNLMICVFCREGLVGEAKQLFLKMEDSGCPANRDTYNVIIQGYLENKHYDEVEMLLQGMIGSGFSLYRSTAVLLVNELAKRSLDYSLYTSCIRKLLPKD